MYAVSLSAYMTLYVHAYDASYSLGTYFVGWFSELQLHL
jgi:hypothetical protein